MGVQRKRRRREERLEEEEQELEREPAEKAVQEKEREREASPTDRVLELQKTAGNRATTAAISRWGFPGLPMTAAPQWPKEPQVIIDGKVIPLQSWSWADRVARHRRRLPPARGGSSSTTSRSRRRWASTPPTSRARPPVGEHIKTVVVVLPGKDGKGVTFTFHDVLITSYRSSEKRTRAGR